MDDAPILDPPWPADLDPITNREMAQRIGVSDQRASQIVQRLWYHRDRCRPPAGVWMPQITEADRDGWPDDFTAAGVAAVRRLCSRR